MEEKSPHQQIYKHVSEKFVENHSSKKCENVNDEPSAFQEIINTKTTDAVVDYRNIYHQRNRIADDTKNRSKRSMDDTNRAEILAFFRYFIFIRV